MDDLSLSSLLNTSLWLLIMAKAIPLFMTLDPLGNIGIITTIIQNFDPKTQHKILRREVLIAFIVMLFFYGFGSIFLAQLDISQAAVEITGGIVLFIFAINLLFPHNAGIKLNSTRQEPFIVPIAVPIIAGPSCLASIMLFSHETTKPGIILSAICLAWLAASIIILIAPLMNQVIGKTGLRVLEQIMGLLCGMIAIKMFLSGITTFLSY